MLQQLIGYVVGNPVLLVGLVLAGVYLWRVKDRGPETGGPKRTIDDLFSLLGDPDMENLDKLLRARLGDPATREQTVQLIESAKTDTAPAATKAARKR